MRRLQKAAVLPCIDAADPLAAADALIGLIFIVVRHVARAEAVELQVAILKIVIPRSHRVPIRKQRRRRAGKLADIRVAGAVNDAVCFNGAAPGFIFHDHCRNARAVFYHAADRRSVEQAYAAAHQQPLQLQRADLRVIAHHKARSVSALFRACLPEPSLRQLTLQTVLHHQSQKLFRNAEADLMPHAVADRKIIRNQPRCAEPSEDKLALEQQHIRTAARRSKRCRYARIAAACNQYPAAVLDWGLSFFANELHDDASVVFRPFSLCGYYSMGSFASHTNILLFFLRKIPKI